MTTINNNTITITAPCTGTVDIINNALYIVDLDGTARRLFTRTWDTILVSDGAIVNYGDPLGQAQYEVDGEIDECMILTDHAVDVVAQELSNHINQPITHVKDADCYTVKVGEFTINAEYDEHCRVTDAYGDNEIVSGVDELKRGIEYYSNNGRFLVF